ncbi:MAG: hypothetical protein R6U50_13860 [Desulfobacterales bacterium]
MATLTPECGIIIGLFKQPNLERVSVIVITYISESLKYAAEWCRLSRQDSAGWIID